MEVHQKDDIMIMKEIKIHIKGKRTKRPRPSSALTLTIPSTTTTTSSTTTTTTDDGAPPTNSIIDFMTTIPQNNHNNNDEDVANCLILLAYGQYQPPPVSSPSDTNVYECKTCNRGFTSFQALGGHRASHKKPPHTAESRDHEFSKNKTSSLFICPNKPLLLSCNPNSGSTKGPKVHQCSICGSDFTSGQALGGHMRRHRSVMPMTTSKTTTSCTTSDEHHKSKKHKTLLPLDLNLPAPIEDDHDDETKSSFELNNKIIVFSTPSLVDCHF